MGNCRSKPHIVTSAVPTQENPRQSIPGRTISTPPPGTSTANRARVRTQSQGSALSERRHRDGRDYPPPSSGGNVFILQFPDRQETPSRQFPSGGEAPVDRTRSLSMGATASKGAPSHPSPRRSRATSTSVQGSGHQRVRSTSSATSQTSTRRQGRSRVPFALQILLPNDFRYAV